MALTDLRHHVQTVRFRDGLTIFRFVYDDLTPVGSCGHDFVRRIVRKTPYEIQTIVRLISPENKWVGTEIHTTIPEHVWKGAVADYSLPRPKMAQAMRAPECPVVPESSWSPSPRSSSSA